MSAQGVGGFDWYFFCLCWTCRQMEFPYGEKVRDTYGFPVALEHLKLHDMYADIYEVEENERILAWSAALMEHVMSNSAEGKFETLSDLSRYALQVSGVRGLPSAQRRSF